MPGHHPLGEHVDDERDIAEAGPGAPLDIPHGSEVSSGGQFLCAPGSRPGGMFVPRLVVDHAPPQAADELVREVAEGGVVVGAGGSSSVVVGLGLRVIGLRRRRPTSGRCRRARRGAGESSKPVRAGEPARGVADLTQHPRREDGSEAGRGPQDRR
jgi:hypothetical protein